MNTDQTEPSGSFRIAVTLGDPRGIGPEVTAKALERFRNAAPAHQFLLVGPDHHPLSACADRYIAVGSWSPADRASAGRVAGRAIEQAVALTKSGAADALVTAPIEKSALHAAGYEYPGHTEMLAALCGVPAVAMMMCAEQTRLGGALRVVLATTHLRLADVTARLTTELLVEQATITADALRQQWDIANPRIAFCAVNPHASDDGLFGDEETRIQGPALDQLRERGIAASGPFPADTVFTRALRGEFDAVIAPYHDVGMAAFKTASFGLGVNVTLGLPFPRTSPDHGTAIDIAGKGMADSSSMLEAIELVVRLAQARAANRSRNRATARLSE